MTMADDRDPPIEEQSWIGGVCVVDIGDYRVARGLSRRPFSGCPHKRLTYDEKERRVWCQDCERDVEPFDALMLIVEGLDRENKRLDARRKRLDDAEQEGLRSLAAKEVDSVWRKRRYVPACPSCGEGLFPEDFKNGCMTQLGREYAEARRRRTAKAPNGT